MSQLSELMDKYADLTIRVGINVQENQKIMINAPIDTAPFVRKVVEKAYEAGAERVDVMWSDDYCLKLHYEQAPDHTFDHFPKWLASSYNQSAEEGTAYIRIAGSDPELLKNVDPERITRSHKAMAESLKAYKNIIQAGEVPWTIVSVPTRSWASMVFKNHEEEMAIEALWRAIFKVTRVDTDDPVASWQSHLDQLSTKLDLMNNSRFHQIRLVGGGTDITVELPEDHLWLGGSLETKEGQVFMPNMPTEEIFTAPSKHGVNGTLCSSRPLAVAGTLIEDFTLKIENGKIIDVAAKAGQEILEKLIATDEGAGYLGEIALVPESSPVAASGLLFYNILFDENAASHFAFGNAYPLCLKGGAQMSEDELAAKGLNVSNTHIDFMIGSKALDVDGIHEDGTVIPLMRSGNWVKP